MTTAAEILAKLPEGHPARAKVMAAAAKVRARSKYGAQATVVEGLRFPSKREAKDFQQILLLQRAGEIRWFCRQPRFWLAGVEYVADFMLCMACDGRIRVIDSKGVRTQAYRIKAKQMQQIYGITVEEW